LGTLQIIDNQNTFLNLTTIDQLGAKCSAQQPGVKRGRNQAPVNLEYKVPDPCFRQLVTLVNENHVIDVRTSLLATIVNVAI
jgi:hypothetical protein